VVKNSDIDGKELFMELKILLGFLPREEMMGPVAILKFLKQMGCFPNAFIAYRILLTIPVTVASAERSSSKLKLLNSYLRSTITQERLNGLATIAIENDVLEKIKYMKLSLKISLLRMQDGCCFLVDDKLIFLRN